MGFLKKLFGGSKEDSGRSGSDGGIFLYVRCSKCQDKVRLYIHKSQELNRSDNGYIWHKTIVDNKCFRPITTVVKFDNGYHVVNAEIDGGEYITEEEYNSAEA